MENFDFKIATYHIQARYLQAEEKLYKGKI